MTIACKSGLSIEQKLLVLSEAIQRESFEMDTERICAILVEAAETILKLRKSEIKLSLVEADCSRGELPPAA